MIKKKSKQRDALIEILSHTKSHPTAEQLFFELRKLIPNISLGTVYRNLAQLEEEKMITRLNVGGDKDHFDGNPLPHYHMACHICGSVSDVEMEPLVNLNDLAEKACGGEILHHFVVFSGKCRICANNEIEN